LLAFVNLVTGTELDESVALLKRALAISPGRNDIVYMLAEVHLRKEDYQTARQLLQQITGDNVEPQVRQRAQSLLAQLGSMEEQAAKFRAFKEEQAKELRDRSTQPESVNVIGQSEAAGNFDPSSYLRDALRKPLEGESQVQGLLVSIDCDAKGIVFVVKVADRLLRLKTTGFEHLDITSFSSDAGNEVTCGARKRENMVVMTYEPKIDVRSKTEGIAKSLEFVPKEFQLKPNP
jgi:alkyl sulfatase BDS1-like metallo-beta-lactamase superfamily hydrolase